MADHPDRESSQENTSHASKDESSLNALPQTTQENASSGDNTHKDVVEVEFHPDCPVCLQPAFYPVKLPCGHIFCFLCIKGVALRGRKCAICRQAIAAAFLEKPTLVKVPENKSPVKTEPEQNVPSDTPEQQYLWYYEGRNGWWQYDDKTSKEVEACFKSGKRSCTLLIAGFLYLIDFENMFQMRRNEPGRRRRIKRDKRDVESKGVAGIRLPKPEPSSNSDDLSPSDSAKSELMGNKMESQTQAVADQPRSCVHTHPETGDSSSLSDDSQGGAASSSSTLASTSQDVEVGSVKFESSTSR